MYSKCWLIIKDDAKKTFEVIGQSTNDNAFTNATYAMQRAGMRVSAVTPPITNATSSKNLIRITGYTAENGLHERLTRQFRTITMNAAGDWDMTE